MKPNSRVYFLHSPIPNFVTGYAPFGSGCKKDSLLSALSEVLHLISEPLYAALQRLQSKAATGRLVHSVKSTGVLIAEAQVEGSHVTCVTSTCGRATGG